VAGSHLEKILSEYAALGDKGPCISLSPGAYSKEQILIHCMLAGKTGLLEEKFFESETQGFHGVGIWPESQWEVEITDQLGRDQLGRHKG
jgi:hypothetical protein